ncbi:uncharacterized protein PV09_03637 [Verruconis gallopava]|uniref:Uncharacterized protein n=1 Tax=Verruconis gallopava TaxID=253628 RepID=A0A0D1YYK0_9PEZI|nr:uncharacterized protein PV09_03637 [Verruconis gallopava]KIW05782.1 hypothetical protein PV09_03637 [Verruconis gallopava]
MPVTRRSARLAHASSSPVSSPVPTGSKRKATASPEQKTSRKSKKSQRTLEETISPDDKQRDVDMETEEAGDADVSSEKKSNEDQEKHEDNVSETKRRSSSNKRSEGHADLAKGAEFRDTENRDASGDETSSEASVSEGNETKAASKSSKNGVSGGSRGPSTKASANAHGRQSGEEGEKTGPAENRGPEVDRPGDTGSLVEDSTARSKTIASNIIEKGIIYFFIRGRVNVDEPEGVQDLQRTYFVLRPIPTGAKLGSGPIDDRRCNRLLALPKKVFPRGGKDRYMVFVEKAKASMSELKEQFFQGSDYETKAGESRHTPNVVPAGEGVYAITDSGRSSHLVYVLTVPTSAGQLQDELGIRSQGSFVLSLKNPKNKGSANAQLPESPDFPQSIMDDFKGLAWMPVRKPEYLDYPNAQLLLIGEGHDKLDKAVEGSERETGKESLGQELEKLENEDQIRVDRLDGEDAVFKDLHVGKEQYSAVKTTW